MTEDKSTVVVEDLKNEGNKLIAEFKEGFFNEKGQMVIPDHICKDYFSDTLKYNSDWSVLMPVIEKISKIECERWESDTPFGTETVIDTFYPRTFGMLSPEGKPMFRFNRNTLFTADTLIEAAWLAVVDFITQDNAQSKTKA